MLDSHPDRIARRAMTLIELIVVLTVVAVLATLVVVFIIPAFQDNKNAQRGSDRVTTALLIAKQRALRDQAPRGVRFITSAVQILVNVNGTPTPTPFTVAQQLQYIEQPEPLSSTGFTVLNQPGQPPTNIQLSFASLNPQPDFLGGADTSGPPYHVDQFDVQYGDYFRVLGANYLIAGPFSPVWTTNTASRTDLRLMNGLQNINASAPWQIIRQSRPISGEALVDLPQNVAVDLTTVNNNSLANQVPTRQVWDQSTNPPTLVATYFEILFDSGGGILNQGSTTVVLVVSDITGDYSSAAGIIYPPQYTTRVLSINPRTGMIAASPLSSTGNPLQLALDGKSSGL
jgi:prepilin-type N-terminal cleavage/methylation domain-containing protein